MLNVLGHWYNSANAAEALVALSNKLDNQGGVFSWFTGDKDLSVFGERLISFGENFALYSKKMEGVKSDIVNKTTSAAESIVELQKKFTEADNGGWFSNNKNLTDFGSDMKIFGENFSGYYNKVKGINTDHLAKVITQVNDIIQIAIGVSSLNMDGMKKFSKELGSIGESGINAFMKAFTDAKSQIEKTAQNMIDYFIDTAIKNSQTFEATFTNLTQDALNGMDSKMSDFDKKGSKAVSEFIDGALSKNNDLVKSSQQLMNGFINGIGSRQNSVKDQIITVVIFAISSVRSKYNDFYDIGVYFIDGFILGLKANISKVEEAAKAVANAAKNSAKSVLDEHSPSKVGYEIGNFFGTGFVNGITSYEDISYNAGENIARSAKNGLQSALAKIADSVDGEMDIQPTIRPVVDLSDVRKSADSISNMLNADRSVYLARSAGMAVNMSKADIQNEIHINNDGVIKEINNLRKDISQLSDTVGRMKIVMDTGELVGAIATPIDRALGRQSVYIKRGN